MENIKKLQELAQLFKGGSSVTAFVDNNKMIEITDTLSALNENYNEGSSYGTFKNNKNEAICLGFVSVYIDGVTIHFNTEEKLIELISNAALH